MIGYSSDRVPRHSLTFNHYSSPANSYSSADWYGRQMPLILDLMISFPCLLKSVFIYQTSSPILNLGSCLFMLHTIYQRFDYCKVICENASLRYNYFIMRIVAIADIQGKHHGLSSTMLPDGDVLICAGDLTSLGSIGELVSFNAWLKTIQHKYKHIVLVAGNHDLLLNRGIDGHTIFTNAIYLQDEMVEIEGYSIWGTPASNCGLYARYWEFCDDFYVRRSYEMIPDKTDIVVSHGPAYGILDKTVDGQLTGSRELLASIDRIKPQLVVHGHIHEAYATAWHDNTLIVNAALCDEENNMFDPSAKLLHPPFTIDL